MVADIEWSVDITREVEGVEEIVKSYPAAVALGARTVSCGPIVWTGDIDGSAGTAEDGVYRVVARASAFSSYPDGLLSSGEYTVAEVRIDTAAPQFQLAGTEPEDYFSPNGPGAFKQVAIKAETGEQEWFEAGIKIYCASGNLECVALFGAEPLNSQKRTYTPVGGTTEIVFVWNGSAQTSAAPDGDYRYEISLEDRAGNISTATGTATKDDPPVISVAEFGGAFSKTAEPYAASIEWSADQEGVFSFDLFDETKGQLLENLANGVYHQAGTHTFQWDGGQHEDGTYYIRISGRDMKVAPQRENACAPKWTKAAIDSTPPVVEAFFPLNDEFTELDPRIKLNIYDAWSGFDAENAAESVEIMIDGVAVGNVAIEPIESDKPNAFRAWADVNPALTTEGPRELTATIRDRAGNVAQLPAVRFMAIKPLEDDFSAADIEKRWKAFSNQPQATNASMSVDGGRGLFKVNYHQSHTGGGIEGGAIIRSFGDVTRKRMVVEAKGMDISCDGPQRCGGGIYIGGIKTGDNGEVISGAPSYHVMLMASFTVWDAYGQSSPKLTFGYGAYGDDLGTSPRLSSFYDVAPQLLDVRIVYEEGALSYYFKPTSAPEESYILMGADKANISYIWTAVIGIGISSAQTGDSITVSFDEFTTDIAQPVIHSMTSKNVTTQTQAMTTIEYGEEQFEIVVEGTPWQKDVKARFDNAANPKFNIFSGKSGGGETAYGPYVLVETEPGMYTTGPITADRTKDADGIDARYLIPVANTNLSRVSGVENINITFGYDIYVEEMLRMVQEGTMTQEEMQQIMMSNMLMLITNAVQSVEFTNLDGPPMYEYIKPGERYKVVAATKPGNWDINVVLLNLATFQQRGFDDIEAAIVAGPMKLTKVIEGKYEIIGALGSITDGSGAVADLIIPLLYFGPVESPEYKFGNQLIIGEPIIREALVKNMARPGAEDVVEGETVKITAIANTGQSLMAALFNTGNPDPNALALVGVPIVMEEVSPRQYEAVLELKMLKDWTGTTVTGIMGVAVTPPIQPPDEEPDFAALSYNQLVALEGDRIAPDRPEKPVTISDVEKTPDIGETVTSRFTWTPSSKNEDGSEITDLAGFNIFRVRTIQAQGSFSVAAGSDQMQLSGSEGHYNLSNSALEYQGNIYVGSQINSGAAGWLKKVTTDLTPLPLIDSDFIEPGKHVLACVVNLDLTGMIYGKGAYSGTIYTQDSREAVARWIEKLIDTGIAELGSGIDACTLAFTPNPDGTFTPATQLTALDYYSYESVGEAAAGETVSTDIYAYEHSVYPHAVNAIDMSGNESLPSVITSVPISSEIMADARLLNGPDSVPTGYIQAGESYRLIGNMNVDNGTQAELYLLNLDALENGSTFAQAVIEGPITLDIQGDQFDLTKPLATLEDAAGRTASRLRAVLLLKNHSEEIVTAEGLLKGGVAPVRMVSMSNADRPEKTEIRTGENVLVTAEGNPGLTLIAQLVNPDSVVESIGVAINQDDVQMNEIPSGSGHYEVTARLITNQDKLGASAQRLAAVVSDISGTVNPPVPSSESLNLLVPPSLTGTLAIHPELIRTGWSFESTYTLTNNSQESLSPVTISGSVATPDGQYTYTAASEENLTGGSTIDGTFLHSAVYLSPAVYDVSLWIDINGYQSQVTTTPITIVGDILDGSIVLDRPVYISSETVSVNYSLTNVSGLTSTSANTELRLLDATGTVVQSIPGPTLSELPNNESATGSLSIATPSGLSETERYSLELAAVLDGGEDTIAVASFSVTPEQMLITGFPQPDLIIPNQEPIFEYQLTNNTTSGITNGIITGIIVSPDYVPGNPIFASFEDTVLSLESRDSTHKSATFTPVQATTGEYKILIGFQPSEGSPSETIFETPIWVGSCD
ncbi:MAG: hypothetical protein BWY28_02958 [bacterium ADurb.Bin236]|nr:MAG: hypothetical protein BWY28_02958 [bacterium ADurb.Bin236]